MGHVAQHLADIWFHHVCTLAEDGGPYGGAGAETPFMGRVSQSTKRVGGVAGEELVTDTIVRCPLDVTANVGDHVRLPEPFPGEWEVVAVSTHDSGNQPLPAHRKITLLPKVSGSPGGGSDDGPYGGGPYG